jgi:hypothetical protein
MNEERQRLAWNLIYCLDEIDKYLRKNQWINAYSELKAIQGKLQLEWDGKKQPWHHEGNNFNDKG